MIRRVGTALPLHRPALIGIQQVLRVFSALDVPSKILDVHVPALSSTGHGRD